MRYHNCRVEPSAGSPARPWVWCGPLLALVLMVCRPAALADEGLPPIFKVKGYALIRHDRPAARREAERDARERLARSIRTHVRSSLRTEKSSMQVNGRETLRETTVLRSEQLADLVVSGLVPKIRCRWFTRECVASLELTREAWLAQVAAREKERHVVAERLESGLKDAADELVKPLRGRGEVLVQVRAGCPGGEGISSLAGDFIGLALKHQLSSEAG